MRAERQNSSRIMKEQRVRLSATRCTSSSDGGVDRRERVQVVVRCRPLLEKEVADGRKSCVEVDPINNSVQVCNPKQADAQPKVFTFDRTYDSSSTQRQLYDDVAHHIVHSVMCGYNGTVLAYGQTASGKTFTMDGADDPPGTYILLTSLAVLCKFGFSNLHFSQELCAKI